MKVHLANNIWKMPYVGKGAVLTDDARYENVLNMDLKFQYCNGVVSRIQDGYSS